jgi:GntR family transcriptional regulator, transcriptional repressor for pyruvate dehydrogenase complex
MIGPMATPKAKRRPSAGQRVKAATPPPAAEAKSTWPTRRDPNLSPFRPISARKAAIDAVDQLTFSIVSGWYEVGDKLPTIPELSKAMNVSPPVIGEAIHILSDAGVLDIRRGNMGGIKVKSADIPVAVTEKVRPRRVATTLMSVVEARRPVEIAIVRLAAVRATEEDFEYLERTNARLVLSKGNPKPWTQAHNAFHYAMARAAGNTVLVHIQHELLEEMALILHNFDERFMEPDRTIREHHETLAALRTRDPEIAEAAMHQHLIEFEELADRFDEAKERRAKPRKARRRTAKTQR